MVSGFDSRKEHLPFLHYHMIKLYRINSLISSAVVECYDGCLAVGTLVLLLLGSTVRAPAIVLCVFLLNALTARYPVLFFFKLCFKFKHHRKICMKILCLYVDKPERYEGRRKQSRSKETGSSDSSYGHVSSLSRLSYTADVADGTLTLLFQKRDTDKNTASSN